MLSNDRAARFWSYVRKTEGGCWEWQGAKVRAGYGAFLCEGRKQRRAHRLAYELERGEIPHGKCVCHSCDNPGCVNPAHLWLGTHADNVADMLAKGRQRPVSGAAHRRAKLSLEQVEAIRSDPRTLRAIGDEYGMSESGISLLKSGKRWKSGLTPTSKSALVVGNTR